MELHASSSRVASTPLTLHLYNGFSTEIWSFRLGGTNPESQHFWVSGHAPAALRGLSADDALSNGWQWLCTVMHAHTNTQAADALEDKLRAGCIFFSLCLSANPAWTHDYSALDVVLEYFF